MDAARSCALETLNRVFSSGAYAAQTIDAYAKQHELSATDTAFATALTYGVIRTYRLLDAVIDRCAKVKDLPVRNALRLGAYQLYFMSRIPKSAAVNESVKLISKSRCKSAAPLVNAVLRKLSVQPLPQSLPLAVRTSHPDWFCDELTNRYGAAFTEALLESNNQEAELCYHESMVPSERYVQDRAAYESVRMLAPAPGSALLDLCAAPGGKSFTAAMLMNNEGRVLSCDVHEKKLHLISDNARRLGLTIIETRPMDAAASHPEIENSFDAVIADVPCSGFGVIRKKPEIRLRTKEEVATLPAVQKQILQNAIRFVRPGGKVLYSTCTVRDEENHALAASAEGARIIAERAFFPHTDHTDGFYAAILEKL